MTRRLWAQPLIHHCGFDDYLFMRLKTLLQALLPQPAACSFSFIAACSAITSIIPNPMSRIVLFNKPFRVLSQFRAHENKDTLAKFFQDKSLRVAGRLDYDSEGLLILSDDGKLISRITEPKHKLPKTYWAQVEGEITDEALASLRSGVVLNDGMTRPAQARRLVTPEHLWPRDPPIRQRASIPTSWIELTLTEGRNRQVRRMTAAISFPTLRLVRHSVGEWQLASLQPGDSISVPG
jgi:23S rRNA pseudouridine2457 synthase